MEFSNFDEAETDNFKKIVMATAEAFDSITFEIFDSKQLEVNYCSHPICTCIANPDDEWQFRLDVRVKQIASSSNKVTRTLWEVWPCFV